jgi:hypothetical protein
MMTKAKNPTQLYMVLDVTRNEDTKLRFIAPIKEATLLGQIYALEHPDRKVIAPPMEGRSFAKLDLLQLQWLFWNTFNEKPFDDYQTLVRELLARFQKMEPNSVELASLEATKAQIESTMERSIAPGAPAATRKPRAASSDGTPKKGSTCDLVWTICEQVLADCGGNMQDPVLRPNIMVRCIEREGINKSTAAVQFSKWRASKNPTA